MTKDKKGISKKNIKKIKEENIKQEYEYHKIL